ncbi:hypothetical protein FAI40_06655 [Acetobacteraceae bacterium]|nr:hypothetical protein FAI40_06655 [Acetobacteraceae bacterium]
MMPNPPHILIFGLGNDCAQSALEYLKIIFPKALFSGWTNHPENIPPSLHSFCQKIDVGDLNHLQEKNLFNGYNLIIFTPPARFLPKILERSHCPIVALGSTRKYTQWPDSYALEVLKAERLLLKTNRPSFFLHPTMIFGDNNNQNISKLAKIVQKFKILPLPQGGKNLIQPIHYQDVGKSIAKAGECLLKQRIQKPESLIIAGKESYTYKEVILFLSNAQKLSQRFIVPLPLWLLLPGSKLLKHLGTLIPKYASLFPTPQAIRRLTEDKHFSISEMEATLGFSPQSLTLENWQKKIC